MGTLKFSTLLCGACVMLFYANYSSASPNYNKYHINHRTARDRHYMSSASSEMQMRYLRDIEEDVFNRLRIKMQKSLILAQLPTELLPPELINAEESEEDQEMIEDLELLAENSGEETDIDLDQMKADGIELLDEDEEPTMEGWLRYFKPMYLFLRDYYRSFNNRQRKIKESWRKLQEKKNAAKEEEGDSYRVGDFEQELEQREIIFLDEVGCDKAYGGYYRTSQSDDHLDFCLQVDRAKFKHMVESDWELETNSVTDPPQLQVIKAELWFYKGDSDPMDSRQTTFSVTAIDDWDMDGRFKKFQMISLKQSPMTVGWIKVDIQSPVVDWLSPMAFATIPPHYNKHQQKHRKRFLDEAIHRRMEYSIWKKHYNTTRRDPKDKNTFFLNVSCKTCMGHGTTSSHSDRQRRNGTDDDRTGSYRPFFLIDYKRINNTVNKSRDKRNLKCGHGVQDCCLESLYINFSQIGLPLIINPPGYYANFCRGSCTSAAANALRSQHSANLHLSKYVKDNAKRLGVVSCCSASKYKDLQVQIINQNNNTVDTRTLSNIIAGSCGCH